ncbi:polyhydroxyalkanoate depolymerase (plasmid) [Paraburkholderia sprentiae WSM5005]|uniref:Polyhydroxyalkanoate depolymerase n=1 Tax=Paraburkholderia sprentiae WSM5005 TaxID=754502 RepID=A0ACA8AUU6_9BURK|nr:polyhydroxyalkanoate depolymerase [Paraburkholderia sprentiae]APA89408.1 polyhydroxyalkanoate depolymerase [Paraburkholderia sprentiae WSM5005]
MWYAFIDAQQRLARAMVGGVRSGSESGLGLQAGWLAPEQAADAFSCWLLRSTCAFGQTPPFDIRSIAGNGSRVTVDESVVASLALGALLRFKRNPPAPCADEKLPVLLCAPLAGHHSVMLRETVETLLEERDVFVTDWADARDVPPEAGPLSLDDYVRAIESFVGTVRAFGSPVHVVAICQASVAALGAAALLAEDGAAPIASVSLLGGPIDTRLNPTVTDRFASSHTLEWFHDNAIDIVPPPYRGAGRLVYPGFIQQAALFAAHPERRLRLEADYWSRWLAGDMSGAQRALRSANDYAAVLDMAECYFLDMLRVVFHEHLLPRDRWSVAGREVRIAALRDTPLCTIEGDSDEITGAGQTHCAHALCDASPLRAARQLTIEQCNHYDLFIGPRWRDAVHPALREFWSEVEHAAPEVRRPRRAAKGSVNRRSA